MYFKIPYFLILIILSSNLYGINTLSIFGLPSNQKSIEDKKTYIIGKNEFNESIWSVSYITKKQYDTIPLWIEKKEENKLNLIPKSILYNYYGKKTLIELENNSNSITFKDPNNLWEEAQFAIHNYLKIMDRIWITTLIAKEGPIIHMLGVRDSNIQSKAFYIRENSTDLESTIITLSELESLTNQKLFPKIKNKLTSLKDSKNTLINYKSLVGFNYIKPTHIPENPKSTLIYKEEYYLNILKQLYLDNLTNNEYIKNINIDKTISNIKIYYKFGLPILILPVIILIIMKRKSKKYIHNQIIFNLRKISQKYKGKIKNHTLNCSHPPISISYKKTKHKHYSHILEVRKERNDGESWKFEAYEGKQKKKIKQKLEEFKNKNENETIDLKHLTILSSENKNLENIIDINTWGLLADFPYFRRFHIHMNEKYVVVTIVTTPDKSDEKFIEKQLNICEKIMRTAKVQKNNKKEITQVIF